MIQFRELLRRLKGADLEFVVVGGVAAVLHGAAEPTRDLDVCIRPEPGSWRRVHAVISPLHPRFALMVDRRPIEAGPDELATFKNLYVLTDLGRIDFLGEIPPLGGIDALHVEPMKLDELVVNVLSINDLIAVKEHVRRPKDLEVAAELRAIKERLGVKGS